MTNDVTARAQALYAEYAATLKRQGRNAPTWDELEADRLAQWMLMAHQEGLSRAGRILNEALAIVSGNRQTTNGAPERSLEMLAAMWSAFLGVEVTATDAGLMLAQLKMVRAKTGVTKDDHFVDGAGYFALAGEVAAKANNGDS